MDTILKFSEAVIEESKKFASSCLEQNEDFRKLDYENQCKVLTFCASVLATFRLVLLASRMRETDFFKD